MRHETCLNCIAGATTDATVQALILVSESLGDRTHHHHSVTCEGCGRWWFDDIALNGLGIPSPIRRDTELCGCEEGLPQYTAGAVLVPGPESGCGCDKASTEMLALPVRMRPAR